MNELTNAVWSARAVGSCTIKSDGEIIRLVDARQVVVSVAKSGRSVGFFDPRIPRSGVRVGMVGGELARVAPTLDQIDCERGPRWFGDYLQCRLRGPQTLDCDNADGDVLIVLFDPRERDATTKGDAARASVRDREIRGLVETSCD